MASLDRLDALIVKTEQRITEQTLRFEADRYGALSVRLAMCRLADLRVDLRAYKQARDAIAAAQRLSEHSEARLGDMAGDSHPEA